MARQRNQENIGLPNRWRFTHGAYYYQVPAHEQKMRGGKQTAKLGITLDEAKATFEAVCSGGNLSLQQRRSRAGMAQMWNCYDPACGIPLSWLRKMMASAKFGAQKRDLDFSLTTYQLSILARRAKGRCMLTGRQWDLGFAAPNGKRVWAPSIDRIDCGQGYTEHNCRLVCIAVNLALSDMGEGVLREIAELLVSRRNSARPI